MASFSLSETVFSCLLFRIYYTIGGDLSRGGFLYAMPVCWLQPKYQTAPSSGGGLRSD
jgi:hypothetical protein